eukprot:s835_g2.t1
MEGPNVNPGESNAKFKETERDDVDDFLRQEQKEERKAASEEAKGATSGAQERLDLDPKIPFLGVDINGELIEPNDQQLEQHYQDWMNKKTKFDQGLDGYIRSYHGALVFKRLATYILECGYTAEEFKAHFAVDDTFRRKIRRETATEEEYAHELAVMNLQEQSRFMRRFIAALVDTVIGTVGIDVECRIGSLAERLRQDKSETASKDEHVRVLSEQNKQMLTMLETEEQKAKATAESIKQLESKNRKLQKIAEDSWKMGGRLRGKQSSSDHLDGVARCYWLIEFDTAKADLERQVSEAKSKCADTVATVKSQRSLNETLRSNIQNTEAKTRGGVGPIRERTTYVFGIAGTSSCGLFYYYYTFNAP